MDLGHRKSEKGRLSTAVFCILFTTAAVCALVLFFYFNGRTRKTVQTERINYTAEIADQLTRNIDNLQSAYAREVEEDARILHTVRPADMKTLQQMFPDRENAKHFLITDSGQMVDTTGRIYTISDEYFSGRLYSAGKDKVLMTYTTVNLSQDYILFGQQIEPLTIGGKTYVAGAVGVTSDQFRKNMTISLFSGLGAGYLVAGDGTVVIKPDDSHMTFSGYNFFSALSAGGVPDAQIRSIRDGMKNGSGTASVTVNGANWLISYKSTAFNGDHIIVAVPLSITAADTYRSMDLTVIFAFAFIILLSAVMGMILLYGFRRRREEDRRAAATDAQTSFLAKMSHDIRTPLNAVIGMLELAGDPAHSRGDVDGFIAKARESANYLLELINDMLDLQKISSGKMQAAHDPFSMRELLESIDSMYKPVLQEKGLDFVITGAGQFDGNYIGDGIKVKQILMNLLSNAMKFTPRGGKVTLSAVHTALDSNRDEVQLTVADSGIGMSEEFQKRIFQPFEQEKASATSGYIGTGLGLNIVRSFTELMGGSVTVRSVLGAGSSFQVTLPLERSAQVLPPKTEPALQPVPFDHQRILLAEDNEINQQIAVLLMHERLNLEVDAVDDGKMAVQSMEDSQPGTYAAVILDVRMPVMDGLQAARAIRALDRPDAKTIPILALSANTYEEDARQSIEAGMNAHLAKPIDIGELSVALHKYIG